MNVLPRALVLATLLWAAAASGASPPPASSYDAALAKRLGGNDNGMRPYVLVILKSGPTPVPEGAERKAMFAGHFANMERLAAEGKLVAAGPLDGVDGWRGVFVLAVPDIEEAKRLTETDPVIVRGEMVGEYHTWFSSAALMQVPAVHKTLSVPKRP